MPALAPAAEQIRARLDARCHANDRHWQLTQPAHLPDSVVLMAGICCIEKVLDVVGLCLDPPEMALFLAVDGEEPDPGPIPPPQRDPAEPQPEPGRGERGAARRLTTAGAVLALGTARDTRLVPPSIALQRWWQACQKRPRSRSCKPRSTRSR
jgi:hypothetical protein